MITFNRVTKQLDKFFLRDISLNMEPGYITGLIGRNGAGKSSLFNTFLGGKYTGEIFLKDMEITRNPVFAMENIGFVSEDRKFFDSYTLEQNINIFGKLYSNFDKNECFKHLAELKLDKRAAYKNLSRGEKLKFQLAFVIAHSPALYLLDEVTAGMDVVFRIDFFNILREIMASSEAAVLMTSHILYEIEKNTDYVALMKKGELGGFIESLDIREKSHA